MFGYTQPRLTNQADVMAFGLLPILSNRRLSPLAYWLPWSELGKSPWLGLRASRA
jgi:hypothetical protein